MEEESTDCDGGVNGGGTTVNNFISFLFYSSTALN